MAQLLRNFESDLEITAIIPGFGGALTSLEERLAHVPRFETVEDLVARGACDAALVCLPNDETPAAVVTLAQAGKHVLVEKPGAASASAAHRMMQAVRQSGVVFQSGYMWRYDEGADRMRQMVAEGRFGRHISTEVTFVTSDVRYRGADHYLFDAAVSGGGFFNWLGCHVLDLLLDILQQPVVGVTARCGVFGATPVDVEDGGVAILDLADGSLATVLGGYWIPRWEGEFHWCTRGNERWVQWEPSRPGTDGVLQIHGPKPQWIAMEDEFIIPQSPCLGYGGGRGQRLVQDWLEAIRTGGRHCRNTPESGTHVLALIDAIYQSSREQRRIACDIGDSE